MPIFSIRPEVLPRLRGTQPGADLVVATRHSDGGGVGDWGVARRLSSWGAAKIGRWLLPEVYARVSDPLSGCYLVAARPYRTWNCGRSDTRA